MKKGTTILIAIVLIFCIALVWSISTSNSLVQLQEEVQQMYSQIETTLQRRSDLIPNLVSTVRGYATHEEKIFIEIAEARTALSGAISSRDIDEIKSANDGLSSALGRLLAIQENYPELKANTQFTALMDELAGTENRITVARQQYNETVAKYNKRVKVFPTSIIANMRGFTAVKYFEADETSKSVPTVNF